MYVDSFVCFCENRIKTVELDNQLLDTQANINLYSLRASHI